MNSVNAHAEDLRSSFVAHEGKKELKVTVDGGDRYTVDFGYMAELMTTQIHENVRIPGLNWKTAERSVWLVPGRG